MSMRREVVDGLMDRLEDLQRQIYDIHRELMNEVYRERNNMDDNTLTKEEIKRIEAIRKEDDYKAFAEWENEEK